MFDLKSDRITPAYLEYPSYSIPLFEQSDPSRSKTLCCSNEEISSQSSPRSIKRSVIHTTRPACYMISDLKVQTLYRSYLECWLKQHIFQWNIAIWIHSRTMPLQTISCNCTCDKICVTFATVSGRHWWLWNDDFLTNNSQSLESKLRSRLWAALVHRQQCLVSFYAICLSTTTMLTDFNVFNWEFVTLIVLSFVGGELHWSQKKDVSLRHRTLNSLDTRSVGADNL